MLVDALQSMMAVLDVVRPALTAPGFVNFRVLFAGWVLSPGRRAVTEALVQAGISGHRHHEAFHRFFSRGAWLPDDVGHLLFLALARALGGVPRRFVIDDTLVHKRGQHIFGNASHLDPVRSTKRFRILAFGHVWVVFAVLVRVPFSTRCWALPLLFRLYRGRKECLRKRAKYRRKTDLAREMLDVAATWIGDGRLSVAMDSAYCCDTVMRGLPASISVWGSLRGNAALTAPPSLKRPKRVGRPSVRGARLPSPRQMIRSKRCAWKSCEATLYGKRKTVRFKEVVAQWYRGCGARLLRVVVTESDDREMIRVFFSTDASASASELLEAYSDRWAIEVCFRNLKQLLGFGDSSARKKNAVERVAPFVGLSYTALVLWAVTAQPLSLATMPTRPWYRQKTGLSFADILRIARRTLSDRTILDPALRPPIETSIAQRRRGPVTRHSATRPRQRFSDAA